MFSSHNRHEEKIVALPKNRCICPCYRTSWSSSSVRWFFGALVILSFSLIHNFRSSLLSEAEHEPTISKQPLQKRSVRFIPYPHRTLGSGASLQCQWETRPILGNNNTSLDFTQQNAYTEGICIPPTLNETLHIFSSEEAIECLSSQAQNRDIKLMLSGDSYMKQLTIGLADILLSTHIRDDEEMMNANQREEILSVTLQAMEQRRSKEKDSFPFVKYGKQCYGRQPLNTTCHDIIDKNNSTDYVWIIGSAVHIYRRQKEFPINGTVKEITNFLYSIDQVLFVSPPFYYPCKEFSEKLVRDQAEVYKRLLHNVAPKNAAHPFLDVYELTRACRWENCSFDKAHRSRFVNRWKAQMLLNTLCEVEVQ